MKTIIKTFAAGILLAGVTTSNYVKNGDFEDPAINGWTITTIPHWEGVVEIGKGNIYNGNWGTSQVI